MWRSLGGTALNGLRGCPVFLAEREAENGADGGLAEWQWRSDSGHEELDPAAGWMASS